MSHYPDNVRPLIRYQVSRRRLYGRPAKVIPFRSRVHDPHVWRAAGFFLLATAVAVLLTAMLVMALPSRNDILIQLAPGWPWW